MNRARIFSSKSRLSPPRSLPGNEVKVGRFYANPLGWVQFSWDLPTLRPSEANLPSHYQIAPAIADDTIELRKVLSSCFMLDPVWSPAIGEVMQKVQSLLDSVFSSDKNACLALRHGSRIIGAALLSLDPDADNHLAPGPSILIEYRNRGFGTMLLEHSLDLLRQSGVVQARGIVRDIAPAAKFLYPKFGGVSRPADLASPVTA